MTIGDGIAVAGGCLLLCFLIYRFWWPWEDK